VRARVMQQLMQRAGAMHPALAGVRGWVVGGRSLGARTAALVAHERGLGDADAANNSAGGAREAAGVRVVGAVLSAFPVHMPDTPVRCAEAGGCACVCVCLPSLVGLQ